MILSSVPNKYTGDFVVHWLYNTCICTKQLLWLLDVFSLCLMRLVVFSWLIEIWKFWMFVYLCML